MSKRLIIALMGHRHKLLDLKKCYINRNYKLPRNVNKLHRYMSVLSNVFIYRGASD
jgi:hypothetical protein